MNFETLNVAFRAGIVTKRRPAAQNAMNTAMMRELRDCLEHFRPDVGYTPYPACAK
jgi:enoyl-CoA hydratase/carnithine racemase